MPRARFSPLSTNLSLEQTSTAPSLTCWYVQKWVRPLKSLFQKFYTLDSNTPQGVSPDYSNAVTNFLDVYLATDAVKQAWTFLQAQGIANWLQLAQYNYLIPGVSTSDPAAFRQQLYTLWFQPYARNAILGSTGFKSVFFGEATGTSINRFSNWYGFYLQEQAGTFDYHGWFTKLNVSCRFSFIESLQEEGKCFISTLKNYRESDYV